MAAISFMWALLSLSTYVQCVHGRVCDPELVFNTNPNEYFVNPPEFCNDNNYVGVGVFPEGTSQLIQWLSATTPVVLQLSQINTTKPTDVIAKSVSGNSYQWDGCLSSARTLADGITFNFVLSATNGTFLCSSDFFNLTSSNVCSGRAASSGFAPGAGTSATTTSAGSSNPSGNIVISSGAGSSAPTATVQSIDQLGSSARIGIGVGVGLGVFSLLVLLAAFCFWKRRHSTDRNDRTQDPPPWSPAYAGENHSYSAQMSQSCRSPVHEAGSKPLYLVTHDVSYRSRQELPS